MKMSSARNLVLSSISYVFVSNCYISYCEQDTKKACSKYNSIPERLSWADRKQRCVNAGCEFKGTSASMGSCELSIDQLNQILREEMKAVLSQRDQSTKLNSSEQNDNNANINTSKTPSSTSSTTTTITNEQSTPKYNQIKDFDSIKSNIQELIHDQITSSAVDQIKDTIKDSHIILQQEAKALVLDMLTQPQHPNLFGQILQSIFINENVLSPTREYLYWTLSLPHTINNTNAIAKYQLLYWLNDQGGKVYTDKLFIDFLEWWIIHPLTSPELVVPLISWSLSQKVRKPYIINPIDRYPH